MTDKILDEKLRTGIEQLDAGNTKEAITTLKEYCQNHQDDADSWFYLGDALAEDGQIAEAIERYRAGLKLAPTDLDALTTLGDLLFEAGQHS